MKQILFKTSPLNPVVMSDLSVYMRDNDQRQGSAPTRSFMGHKNQNGYTRVRQTRAFIIIEWVSDV